jgi:hypothetical protein
LIDIISIFLNLFRSTSSWCRPSTSISSNSVILLSTLPKAQIRRT